MEPRKRQQNPAVDFGDKHYVFHMEVMPDGRMKVTAAPRPLPKPFAEEPADDRN